MYRYALSLLGSFLVYSALGVDRLMVGESGSILLDTVDGEISFDSGWHKDCSLGLRLSTVWDAATSGMLSVNGTTVSTLEANAESDFGLILSANTACRYVCRWTVGGIVYTRTLITTGARQKGLSAGISFDSRTGTRSVSSEGEALCYDTRWYDYNFPNA